MLVDLPQIATSLRRQIKLYSLAPRLGCFREYKVQNMWQYNLQAFPIFRTPFHHHYELALCEYTCIFNFKITVIRCMNLPHLKLSFC
jgi:hypothetical protein